jgi:hypothetical protein
MSFRAYLDKVKAKTCKTPRQLKDLAAVVGFPKSDMKPTNSWRGSRRSLIWGTATPWRSGLRSNRRVVFTHPAASKGDRAGR